MDEEENACVRNIVKEIIREIAPKKIKVNKNFVTYLTKLLLINPNWGIGDDFFNQRQNVQHFVKYMIEDLLKEQDCPRIVTLKIQFYFTCNVERMDYILESNKRDLKFKLSLLKDDIATITKAEEKEDIDLMYKKIVYYITLMAGLGNPMKPKVYEEALIALKSILYEEELKEFTELTKHEKHIQLNHFTKTVAGIRLFNKDCDKGGEGIANLPELLDKAIYVIKGGTEETLLMIMDRVNTITTVVDDCYVIRQTYKGYQMLCQIPEEVAAKCTVDIEYFKDLLIFFRQYELLIRKILDELDRIQEKSQIIYANMEKLLKTVHDTVYMKIAIPVGVIFPLFEEVWDIWEQFQDQGVLLSRLSMIMSNLETYARHTRYDHVAIEHIVGDSFPLSDAERLAQTSHLKLTSSNPSVKVVSSESIKNFQNIKLEYLGFCCWKLVETDGALIPGNPRMGIAIFKLKYYVFSCVEGFQEFTKDPQMSINCVLDLARRKPHIINFLGLKEDLEDAYGIEKLVQSKVEIRMCENKSVQTVVHTTDSCIDPSYKWNIWDLKREALTNANISSCGTRSTQTTKTGSKNSIRSQTYKKIDIHMQTMKDGYSNVPKPSVFIYGLRGRTDDQQFKIDLTRPIEEK